MPNPESLHTVRVKQGCKVYHNGEWLYQGRTFKCEDPAEFGESINVVSKPDKKTTTPASAPKAEEK